MTRGKGNPRGILGATRNPAGAVARAQYDRPSLRTSPLWPGWTDDGDGNCTCSWTVKDGVRQVKFANAGCPVRHRAAGAA